MARCADCNKFTSQEPGDPEVNGEEINDDGSYSLEVRIVQNCAECGTEVKEATLELSGEIADLEGWEEHKAEHPAVEHSLEIEVSAEESTASGPTTTPKGKPINPRYVKTLYGADCKIKVTCSCNKGGWEETLDVSDHIAASQMDEIY